tara:strand:+ start:1341 stop:2210 length:870 start_codon:yes stop_codon:yes gene_type:complete
MIDLMKNIKNLREITGVGFLDCKKALEQNNNNIENSVDFLRKKGLAKAIKKSSRQANEGAIGVYSNNHKTILLEVNTETDFAAKNEIFLDFLDKIGNYLLSTKDENNITTENFLKMTFGNKEISEHFTEVIAKIGENIVLKKIKIFLKEESNKIYHYTHNTYRPNIGKICTILQVEINKSNEETDRFGKNLCMHIAASKPLAIDKNELDNNLIEKEKDVQLASINASGKSKEIANKILIGKMNKFFSEVTLLNQPYIFDTDKTVNQAISEFSSKNSFKINRFELFILGS